MEIEQKDKKNRKEKTTVVSHVGLYPNCGKGQVLYVQRDKDRSFLYIMVHLWFYMKSCMNFTILKRNKILIMFLLFSILENVSKKIDFIYIK